MIASLRGKLRAVFDHAIVIDVSGVGFSVRVPTSVLDQSTSIGQTIEVHTHLIVRENEMTLYGFLSPEERELFVTLLGVTGIGPRTALSVTSFFDPEALRKVEMCIRDRDGEEALGAEAVAPWDGMSLDDDDSEDSFLEQAKELVLQHNQASASFLQRQMRIGYPRAARLIDQLEERGIVGPPEAGGRSRSVIADAEQPREVASASDEGV